MLPFTMLRKENVQELSDTQSSGEPAEPERGMLGMGCVSGESYKEPDNYQMEAPTRYVIQGNVGSWNDPFRAPTFDCIRSPFFVLAQMVLQCMTFLLILVLLVRK